MVAVSQILGVDQHQFEHPYLDVLPKQEWKWGYQEGSNIAMLYQGEKPFLLLLGEDRSAIQLLLEESRAICENPRVALPRQFGDLLTGEKSEWDWMGIFARPNHESNTIDLRCDYDEEIRNFLAESSPTASSQPGSEEIVTWHGIRDEHGLAAVGAAIRWKSGAAVLASIATHPRSRGRGLATRITASLTQMFFDSGEKRVTLGLYAGNQPARQAYERVGYQLLGQFTSGDR